MSRPAALLALAAPALVLTACESTQDKNDRLARSAAKVTVQKRLTIGRANPDVKISATTLLHDPAQQRTAVVVTMRNTSARPQSAVPLLFTLRNRAGRKLFANDTPGATADLTSVPLLQPRQELTWVDDQIVGIQAAATLEARVGVPDATREAGTAPKLRFTGVRLLDDPVDGVTATGRIVNESSIPQQRLVIFAVSRRGGRIVAAGRAIVPTVKPGPRGAKFTAFFVGDPRKGRLELHAPPTSL